VAQDAVVSLCLKVTPVKTSSQRGSPATWTVSAWATGGTVPGAVVRPRSTPASGGAPRFTLGCGRGNGTSTCDLGTVNPGSAPRQLQAQLTVPAKASKVTSVTLTLTGSAAQLSAALTAAAAVTITAPPAGHPSPTRTLVPSKPGTPTEGGGSGGSGRDGFSGSGTGGSGTGRPIRSINGGLDAGGSQGSASTQGDGPGLRPGASTDAPVTTPLPAGTLPALPASPSPSGNAADLFPTLHPRPAASIGPKAKTRAVANTSALPEGAPVIGAQLAGLAALALAFVLTVTRLSIRRRPAPVKQPGTDA
jgi:hypothetical protein